MAKKKQKPQLDRAQEKARKQKRLAGVLGAVLLLVLVYEVPHTMKMMHKSAQPPVVSTATAPPAASDGTSAGSTTVPSATPAAGLVSAVSVSPDQGQLTEFALFASKDPFSERVQRSTGAPTADGSSATARKKQPTAAATPKTPPAPPPTEAVISLNGELMSVAVGGSFPTAGTTFDRVGSLFLLQALTRTTAKVTIVGGSYADGAPALTLTVGKPVTLQNTADGTRYTLLLEPPGTQVPAPTATTSTTTTPSVVPSSPSG